MSLLKEAGLEKLSSVEAGYFRGYAVTSALLGIENQAESQGLELNKLASEDPEGTIELWKEASELIFADVTGEYLARKEADLALAFALIPGLSKEAAEEALNEIDEAIEDDKAVPENEDEAVAGAEVQGAADALAEAAAGAGIDVNDPAVAESIADNAESIIAQAAEDLNEDAAPAAPQA